MKKTISILSAFAILLCLWLAALWLLSLMKASHRARRGMA